MPSRNVGPRHVNNPPLEGLAVSPHSREVAGQFAADSYAERHFHRIVMEARETNPFYRRVIPDPEVVPILDRDTFYDHNDEILNGYPVRGTTSGSTGVPIRFAHSPEWVALALEDNARFVRSFGGRVPGVQIVNAGNKDPGPRVLHISSSGDKQMRFILRERERNRIEAITTCPTNAEILSREVLDRRLDMGFITGVGMYGEAV